MDTVTSKTFVPGAVDEAAYNTFVAKLSAKYQRASKRPGMYAGWTKERCDEAAGAYASVYRHNFRTLVAK